MRELRLGNASTRATLAVTCGPSGAAASGGRDKGEAEQKLLDKARKRNPDLSPLTGSGSWTGFSRRGPDLLDAGDGHACADPRPGRHHAEPCRGLLADGSYLAGSSGGGVTLTVRVIEYTVSVAGRDAPELFCWISDLTDHAAYPAGVLAAAYHWRWIGLETALRRRSPRSAALGRLPGRRSGQLPRPDRAGTRRLGDRHRAGPRGSLRRRGHRRPRRQGQARRPVHPREISFTAARRAVITTTRAGTATASPPASAITANRDSALVLDGAPDSYEGGG